MGWPAIDANAAITTSLIDEAAIAADAARCGELRRTRNATMALTELVEASAPLAAAIRSSSSWSQVPGFARADTTRPGVGDIRLARLLDDPALTARANAAFDDKLVRIGLEVDRLSDPTSPATAADLAVLDKR